MDGREFYGRSISFAEAALDMLRRHEMPATPRNFECCYVHVSGANAALSLALERTIELQGRLAAEDLARLYGLHRDPGSSGNPVDDIGRDIADGIADISVIIDRIRIEAARYHTRLCFILDQIDIQDGTAAAQIEFLAGASQRIEAGRRSLEESLDGVRSGFETLRAGLEAVRASQMGDPLTTLATRRQFELAFEQAVTEAIDGLGPLALMITDIDNFKSFNDRYGHQTGDQVLRMVAQSAKQNIRGQDLASRYGGEEFAILLPQTGEAEAAIVGEHIRQAVSSRDLIKRSTGERIGRVTVSIGIAVLRPGDTPQTLLERADTCLYAAKRAGRNRMFTESDLTGRDVA